MTKILTIPANYSQLDYCIKNSDGIIIGITGLCTNNPFSITFDELKDIIKNNPNKDVFVSLNKNFDNDSLVELEKTLVSLENVDCKGILYYDISIVNIKKRLGLKKPLVWAQEHFTTNYNSVNYWYQFGALYALLSSEITLEEIVNINTDSKAELIVPIFGYLPMMVSKRRVVTNYLKTFDIKSNSSLHYLIMDSEKYPIIDNEDGSYIFSSKILNGLEQMDILIEENISYVTLNGFNITDESFKKVINMYVNFDVNNIDEYNKELEKLFENNINQGFLFKETIYKVKKNEK